MNFWENVDFELKYLGISRKKLASVAGFNVSNIANGIRDGNVPSAETALKISSFLGVSIKQLLTGKDDDKNEESGHTQEALKKFKKYQNVIDSLDAMPDETRNPIINMILSMNENEKSGKTTHKKVR